ncbi:MAG: protein kinase [Clostridia bacterium]|nr:protein kinase [Clostridia bacterium]
MTEPRPFDPAALPRFVDGEYRALSCKKVDDSGAVFLAERRDTGQPVLVKVTCSPEERLCLKNEYELLKRLQRAGGPAAARFPCAIACLESEGSCALVREYIPGQSMEEYVESEPARPGIARDMALKCLISVLEQLSVLHRMRPPVIHRDIKPQNVILDDRGDFHLIDLGIAREYRAGDVADTRVMGTSLTAPPEQYGFRQTDARSDIYSAGVLLRYCLTQEYGEAADAHIDAELRAIVRQATQFAPQMRYRRAEDMLAALRRAAGDPKNKRGPTRRRAAIAVAVVALLSVLCLAWLHIRLTVRPYAFREPLIEQAVRLALDRPEGPLTAKDLQGVTALHIFGSQIYDDDGQFWFLGENVFPYDAAMNARGLWRENGGIACLDDLKALPNLRALSLYRQDISDISALQDTKLQALGIGYNPVTDLSPLQGNPNLTSLNVCGLDLSDTGVLATLPHLRALSIAGTGVQTLAGLSGLPLEELNLVDVPFADEASLETLKGLKALTVSKLWPSLVPHLAALELETLAVTHAQGVSPRDLEALTGLKRLSYRTEQPVFLSAEPLRFPRLEVLELKGVTMNNLACLRGLSNLRTLGIYEVDCPDYSGLDALEHLETVWATPAQAAILDAQYPGHGWKIE